MLVHSLKLARSADKFIINETARADFIFHTLKQERVLADLSKLHELITQSLDTFRLASMHFTPGRCARVQ